MPENDDKRYAAACQCPELRAENEELRNQIAQVSESGELYRIRSEEREAGIERRAKIITKLEAGKKNLRCELTQRDVQLSAWHEAFGTRQLTHALARLEKAEAIVDNSASGTKMERQQRLIEIAHGMGFKRAHGAYWDTEAGASDGPVESPEDVAENGAVDTAYEVDIGLYLGDSVWAICQAGKGLDDEFVNTVHDTRAAAQQAARENSDG